MTMPTRVFVVKFGGNAIRGKEDMARLSGEVAGLVRDGARVVLVHGGGPEISAEMERRGLAPKKVAGLRVTDAEALKVAEEVLGAINREMTACLMEASVDAVGMPAYLCTLCRRKGPHTAVEGGEEVTVDLGLVGEVAEVDAGALADLLSAGVTPVIYPIGADPDGNRLNVNADTMAAGIAAGIGCDEMIMITDVPGVLLDVGDPSSLVGRLTLAEADALISQGIISGGMVPKVDACRAALEAGAGAVRMVDGRGAGGMLAGLTGGMPHGTVITR